jgi:hypothetical protein
MAKTRWLAERVEGLIEQLQPLGMAQEEEIARLCEQEIAAWRARPSMKVASSLRVPMTDARNALRTRLALTEQNSWINPRTQEREHLAFKYLNFTNDEWVAMNAPSEEAVRQRREDIQFINDPQAVIRKAEDLLGSPYWQDLALGLSVVTGRRITETLKTGKFHPKSAYTVIFSGQLKKRDEILKPYEIPTLVRAELVLSAWRRLRDLVDCSALDNDQVNAQYTQPVRTIATRHFGSLVPCRAGHEDALYTHLFRCIYGRIAVLYFTPPSVLDLDYLATIYGHYWYFEGDGTKRLNYTSTLHYSDYRIGDGHGNIDGRQGIRLGEPDVEILDTFKPITLQEKRMSKKNEKKTEPVKGHSLMRCKQQTSARGKQIMHERGLPTQDALLNTVFDESALYQQMGQLLAPLASSLGMQDHDPIATLRALITANAQPQMQQQAVSTHLQQRWGVSLEELDEVFEQVREAGHKEPLSYVRESLGKRQNFKEGAQKRAEHFQQLDYARMPFSALERIKTPEATTERIHRAVLAIMAHNQSCQPLEYWYINAAAVQGLVGGRYPAINAYLEAHQQEIKAHHDALKIDSRSNRKIVPIKEMVTIPPEAPEEVLVQP